MLWKWLWIKSLLPPPPRKCRLPKGFSAFTLAEVLIVIGIIGMIADMTIPTLVSSYQKQVTVTSVKKAYSTLTQGFKLMMIEDGCSDLMCTGYFPAGVAQDDAAWNNMFDEAIRKVFRVTKTLKAGDESIAPYNRKMLKSTTTASNMFKTTRYRFVTADGMFVSVYNNGCTVMPYANESKFKNLCAIVEVDTNGLKGPNQFGKDIFGDLEVAQDGTIYPATSYEWAVANFSKDNAVTKSDYWKNSSGQCAKEGKISDFSSVSGQNCLARIIEEGWQINYY